jgi:hypothetical protein
MGVEKTLRPTCSNCAKKHLSQASILLSESKRGYPLHRTYALGHMAEAEEELIKEYPTQANRIRAVRIKLEKNPKDVDNLDKLILMVERECEVCALDHNHKEDSESCVGNECKS